MHIGSKCDSVFAVAIRVRLTASPIVVKLRTLPVPSDPVRLIRYNSHRP
jgi:hypothetical protein